MLAHNFEHIDNRMMTMRVGPTQSHKRKMEHKDEGGAKKAKTESK